MSFSEFMPITDDCFIKLITLFKQFLRVTEVILIILKNWKYLTAEYATIFTSKPVTMCVCCWGEQVEFSGLTELPLWKQLLEAAKKDIMSAPKMNHNS